MNSTASIDLVNHILQPFQRSLDEALRVMDCSIDEERCRPAVADDASSPVANTDNFSKATRAAAGPDLPLAEPLRPDATQDYIFPKGSHLSATHDQTPSPAARMGVAEGNLQNFSPKNARMLSPGTTESRTSPQMIKTNTVSGGRELISRDRPVIEPNTTKTGNAEVAVSAPDQIDAGPHNMPVTAESISEKPAGKMISGDIPSKGEVAVSGPDQIDAGPHGMPISRGSISEKSTGKEISGDIPESADHALESGRIERLQLPHGNTPLDPNVHQATPDYQSAALIPLKAPGNGSFPEATPTFESNSTIPPAPRPVRRAAGMVAEGLEPVLEQAYGLSQQAFQLEDAPEPSGQEAPPATRVSNNFHVNVSMSGTNSINSEQHEAFEDALVEILRLAARRQGLEV